MPSPHRQPLNARATKCETASRMATRATLNGESADDHTNAAELHEAAAQLHAEGGDAESAAMHLADAKTHRGFAEKMRAIQRDSDREVEARRTIRHGMKPYYGEALR